jgi:hypothetical protein
MSEAQYDQMKLFLDQKIPDGMPPQFRAYPGQTNAASVTSAFAAGITPEQMATDVAEGVLSLGMPVDPVYQYHEARDKFCNGHYNGVELLANYWTGLRKDKPTAAEYRARVFNEPAKPPQPKPVEPPKPEPTKPPVTIPPVTQPGFLEAIIAKNSEQDGRIATLEAKMDGVRKALGATDGGPGGA